eukprot:scaffold57276_cov18-Tisochrysis_lutea.AAC.2
MEEHGGSKQGKANKVDKVMVADIFAHATNALACMFAAMEERIEGLNEVKANKVDVVMVADLATLMAEQAEQLDGRLADYQKENAKVGLLHDAAVQVLDKF